MGNQAIIAEMRDAEGTVLDDTCWVDFTANTVGIAGLGRVKAVRDGVAIVHWDGLGNYKYGSNDLCYYGARRTIADKTGVKLQEGQFVEKKGRWQGMVKAVTDTNALIVFGGLGVSDGWYEQRQIDKDDIRVMTRMRRQCANAGCF
eukprot:CAMPEP_0176082174 /NCGR_PEP_ID=MMETSP0120_2-20121206/41104_1 /TAXON_ID=160619 /ORGANISM="Kryptoperidinium foliaceum, Strain CCMP 1326" /LENGTH=145 /DNA_ID=CAMNT_0017415941 /DNA_START=60 /DNA_END=497 /DNA_ORIENTATION=+